MGIFDGGGDNDDNDRGPDPASIMMQEELNQQNQELAQKRSDLFKQRLEIVKSQGAQDFTGNNANAPILGK